MSVYEHNSLLGCRVWTKNDTLIVYYATKEFKWQCQGFLELQSHPKTYVMLAKLLTYL